MVVNPLFGATNPFITSFVQSDLLGKAILLSLFLLSIVSWIVIVYKIRQLSAAKRNAAEVIESFQENRSNILKLTLDSERESEVPTPFLDLYEVMRTSVDDIQSKKNGEEEFFSTKELDYVASYLAAGAAQQTKALEKNLFLLSTIITLAPFLGLLGTVWGILTTFSHMQSTAAATSNQMVLGGLSLALATTVLGLIDAIPALLGYSYFKNAIRAFEIDMEGFCQEMIAALSLNYGIDREIYR